MQGRNTAAERLGKFLRERRESQGWKLEALGRRVGLSKSYLSKIERPEEAGRQRIPPHETLKKVALAYGIKWAELQALIEEDGPSILGPVDYFSHVIEQARRLLSPQSQQFYARLLQLVVEHEQEILRQAGHIQEDDLFLFAANVRKELRGKVDPEQHKDAIRRAAREVWDKERLESFREEVKDDAGA